MATRHPFQLGPVLARVGVQYLDDAIEASLFPAERVRIARALETRAVLTFEYEGDPIRVGLPVPLTALKRPLEDGELLEGRLNDFVS